jgi:ubiquinone/menaquinone biosynthesis C-methylase UbiE
MLDQFRKRSYKLEHLDIGDYSAEEYEACIIELQRVNRWLGDTHALRTSLIRELDSQHVNSVSVLDVGAGSGELLRVIADWAMQRKRNSQLVGLELNERSARAIKELSPASIASVRADAFKLPFNDNTFDYAICSLFTHHFVESEVVKILREMARVTAQKIFVIDLHRHAIAYHFYTTVAHLFLHNRVIREDGALSILRGFKPNELKRLALAAGLPDAEVIRSFPYRLVLTAGALRTTQLNSESLTGEQVRLAS